jgi:hypothetical protein
MITSFEQTRSLAELLTTSKEIRCGLAWRRLRTNTVGRALRAESKLLSKILACLRRILKHASKANDITAALAFAAERDPQMLAGVAVP